MQNISFSNPQLQLRSITPVNAVDVLPLMQRCYPPVYQHLWEDGGEWYLQHSYRESQVLTDIAAPNTNYWFVDWEGQAVGIFRVCWQQACPDLAAPTAVKLNRIYLHPDTIGQGIGGQLMDYLIAEMHQQGYQHLWLEAMDTQIPAVRFYEKWDMATVGTFRLTFERMHSHLRGMLRMAVKI